MSGDETAAERPGWLLDELSSAGRENLDPAHVAGYDRKEDAEAGREVALLERLGMTRDSTVIELGPGTGQFTTAVAPRCGRVVAVEVSAPMFESLREKVEERRLENVELGRARPGTCGAGRVDPRRPGGARPRRALDLQDPRANSWRNLTSGWA